MNKHYIININITNIKFNNFLYKYIYTKHNKRTFKNLVIEKSKSIYRENIRE